MERGLAGLFEKYLSSKSIFKNKAALAQEWMPKRILYREEQIQQLAKILAPCLRLEKPSNVFIYGKTGTGKTLVARYVLEKLQETASAKGIPLKAIYVNCKFKRLADTEYRLLAQFCKELGIAVPATGLPTQELWEIFFAAVAKLKGSLLICLDEIDQLVSKAGDDVIYNLTRAGKGISMIGISNDLLFTQLLDPRAKSSLGEEELLFPPYNAEQLLGILKERAELAFSQSAVGSGVLEKCSAIAARENGDARRALDLLRLAGELAERGGQSSICIDHVDAAQAALERDKVIEAVSAQPLHAKLVLRAALELIQGRPVFTGELYVKYAELCSQLGYRPLTQRRIADIVAEYDMLGILSARVISKGRYGRTREIAIAISPDIVAKLKLELGNAGN